MNSNGTMFGMCNPAESAGLVAAYPHHHSHHHAHPHSHPQLHHPSQAQQHYGTPELAEGGSSSPFGCSGAGSNGGNNSTSGDHLPYNSLQTSSSGNNSTSGPGNNGLTPTSASEVQRVQQTTEQNTIQIAPQQHLSIHIHPQLLSYQTMVYNMPI